MRVGAGLLGGGEGGAQAVEIDINVDLRSAVLADDAVSRAGHDADRDVAVGLHRFEGLGGTSKLDRRRDRHMKPISRLTRPSPSRSAK